MRVFQAPPDPIGAGQAAGGRTSVCGLSLWQADSGQQLAGLEHGIMKARVFVTLKPSVFDPQGRRLPMRCTRSAMPGVGDVRQGKFFELDVAAASADQARTIAAEVADKLLANPVIESYRVEIE